MNKTKIQWATHTWNPVTGCTKISEGCKNCYAERMARRLAGRYGYPEAPYHFEVTLHQDKLNEPLHWRKPRLVFVCSMGDLFHNDVAFETIHQILGKCVSPHTYMVLTKRPQKALEYHQWASYHGLFGLNTLNIWLGFSAENQRRFDERAEIALQIPAAKHFVSLEPMLEGINILSFLPYEDDSGALDPNTGAGIDIAYPGIDWVIVGSESGPKKRPFDEQWARDIKNQCVAAGVPFFFKQSPQGSMPELDGRVWDERPRILDCGM